ncbi:heme d1 biosynthesis radical SAM protein NirJ2 [Alphaproteobacteria bacterium]|nr:heme d1 biosynthesis radical SAM protein NirJ2 [Alphaproteobacteria bacterium]
MKSCGVQQLKAPFYVQFEVTDKCNNRCFFCYNEKACTSGDELSCDEIKRVLDELKVAGVFSVNLNGGEPLMRDDFFEIMEYASYLGFDLHLNTNGTLIDDYAAKRIARCMRSICTSILHSDRDFHDKATGRKGSYDDVIRGIKYLVKNGVQVEVNVCTSKQNYKDIYSIAKLSADIGCYALCSTRYILNHKDNLDLLMDKQSTIELVDALIKAKNDFSGLHSVTLPGPVPFCELPMEYHAKLASLNIPCQFGYGLCRISATGNVTPCTISDDLIGDLRKDSFENIWNSDKWSKYRKLEHLPSNCKLCDDLSFCHGGYVVYDQSILSCNVCVNTKKWCEADVQ